MGRRCAATDPDGGRVTAITWVRRSVPGSAAAHPGLSCLRTTLVDQDHAALWRTDVMLTGLESVFRSRGTDLGLRPVLHRIDRRVEGRLFISVLAHHFAHTRRQALITQRRDGRTVHVRKAMRPKPQHHTLGRILKLDPNSGRTHRVPV